MSNLVDATRRITTFLLASFLWLHGIFLLSGQSTTIAKLSGLFRLTNSEVTLFVLLIVFSLVTASGFWKTLKSLTYIYFFPFVLMMYGTYVCYLILRAVHRWFQSQANKASQAAVNLSSNSVPVPVTISVTPESTESPAIDEKTPTAILRFLLRPFRRFMFLWCVLLLVTNHLPIVWLCLIVVLANLARKAFFIVELLLFSDPWLKTIGDRFLTTMDALFTTLNGVTGGSSPTPELKTVWNQLNAWKRIFSFLSNSYLLSRWAWFLGTVVIGSVYVYLAILFSFAYYGIAKVNHVAYLWVDALVASIFIPLFASDLPKLLGIRVLVGLHVLLVVTVGVGTIVNYLRRRLDAIQKAANDLRMRFEDKNTQEKYLILEKQFADANVPKPSEVKSG